jgi:Rdx family.
MAIENSSMAAACHRPSVAPRQLPLVFGQRVPPCNVSFGGARRDFLLPCLKRLRRAGREPRGDLSERGHAARAVAGAKSQFDVLVDGELVFSKQAEHRFPEHEEILAALS